MTQRLPRIDEDAFLAAAVQQHQAGQLAEAKDLYRAILTQNPKNAEAIFRLGTMALQLEQYEKAADFIEQSIKLHTNPRAPLYINYGAALRNLERYDEAIEAYDRAIRLDDKRADAYFNKGRALQALGRLDDAASAYETAIALDPSDARAWVNLGTVQKDLEQFDEALGSFERATRIDPNLAAPYANTGSIMFDRGLFKIAMVYIRRALELDPDNTEYRYHVNTYLLMFGHLDEGWRDFDVRFIHLSSLRAVHREPKPPYWDGASLEALTGKKVRLWTEQGLGEEILAAGLLNDLRSVEAEFVCECTERMLPIFARSFPWMKFVKWDIPRSYLDEDASYDLKYPALNLLKLRSGKVDDITSSAPFLQAKPELASEYSDRLRDLSGGKPVVGLGWESKHEKFGTDKSLPLSDLVNSVKSEEVVFVCVQHGDIEAEIDQVRNELGVDIKTFDSTDKMHDLEHAFALIQSLDLVIASSSSTVHMAGALNVPTFVLLPAAYGLLWHWFLDIDYSPWYPSIKTIRQKSNPDRTTPWWPDVLEQLGKSFPDWVSEFRDHRS